MVLTGTYALPVRNPTYVRVKRAVRDMASSCFSTL
jgi:hypothetical protein